MPGWGQDALGQCTLSNVHLPERLSDIIQYERSGHKMTVFCSLVRQAQPQASSESCAVTPPSTTMTAPVTYMASSETSQAQV